MEEWANLVECREDICFDGEAKDGRTAGRVQPAERLTDRPGSLYSFPKPNGVPTSVPVSKRRRHAADQMKCNSGFVEPDTAEKKLTKLTFEIGGIAARETRDNG